MKRSNEADAAPDDFVRSEYDFSQAVRGKYFQRAVAGTGVVILEPDVAAAFPDSASVNRALRLLMELAQKEAGPAVIAERTGHYGVE